MERNGGRKEKEEFQCCERVYEMLFLFGRALSLMCFAVEEEFRG
jgi:hypothetical protein